MAHQAIYRRWRPMTFDDVIGQNHITKTLKNQITSGSVGHAYLFCGTRGTGKTTCAKILSRAVNCLSPKNGNPCNECEICRGIIDGSIMDVTEMDAASNNSVDDIRELKGDISYVAANTKFTVYIIDEVHMLSPSAFNALLKTLEEPPENVIFILATTEPHKLPQTILSRCQRFDFRRIRPDDIIVRMKEIAHGDGYSITDGAYRMLASLADGSMRDGLSIMERVLSTGAQSITEETVTNALGISTLDSVFELTDAIIAGSGAGVIEAVDRTLADGRDLGQLASSMLAHTRALMICKLTEHPEQLLDYDAETVVRIKAQSERLSFEKIDHASTVISQAIADARTARSQRLIYELAYIKLARPETDRSPKGIMDRLSVLEQRASYGAPTPQAADNSELVARIKAVEEAVKKGIAPQATAEDKKIEPKKEEKPKQKRLYAPIPEAELNYDYPTAQLARNWNNTVEIMSNRNIAFVAPLKNCIVTFDAEGLIVLVPEDRYLFTQRMSVAHIESIRELFRKTTGTDYTIKIARREDMDERNILNPFDLPKSADGGKAPKAETVPARQGEPEENKLDEFITKFSDIITDGDQFIPNVTEADSGEQTEMDDGEYDKEEFLDAEEEKQKEGKEDSEDNEEQ